MSDMKKMSDFDFDKIMKEFGRMAYEHESRPIKFKKLLPDATTADVETNKNIVIFFVHCICAYRDAPRA